MGNYPCPYLRVPVQLESLNDWTRIRVSHEGDFKVEVSKRYGKSVYPSWQMGPDVLISYQNSEVKSCILSNLLQYDRNPEDRGQRKIRISGLRSGFYDFSDSGSSVQKSPLQKS